MNVPERNTPFASVVVPTRNRRDSVARLVDGLQRQTLDADRFELVVSIDGSDDDTAAMLRERRTPFALRVIERPRGGRAAACNEAIRAATGDLIVLLDDDMQPSPELLDAHLRAHARSGDLAVIGAVPIDLATHATPLARYLQRRFDTHLHRLSAAHASPALREFFTGNFSIARERLLAAGAFDEAFSEYGHEDLELWVRLRAASCRFAYAPDALAWQSYTKDTAAFTRDAVEEGRTAVLLATKHPAVIPELKLGTWPDGPAHLRALRSMVLAWSERSPAVPARLLWLTRALERTAPDVVLNAWYPLAHGFYYWLGVRAALRDRGLERLWPPAGDPWRMTAA